MIAPGANANIKFSERCDATTRCRPKFSSEKVALSVGCDTGEPDFLSAGFGVILEAGHIQNSTRSVGGHSTDALWRHVASN